MRILGPLELLHPIDEERKKNIKDNQFLQYFKITRITRIFRSEPNKLKGLSFCKNNNFFLKYIIHATSPPPKLSINETTRKNTYKHPTNNLLLPCKKFDIE